MLQFSFLIDEITNRDYSERWLKMKNLEYEEFRVNNGRTFAAAVSRSAKKDGGRQIDTY